ncbi:T9SS type A sorting domain-containing protein [bacterium]|nr:T9SS type A sorting domain-containing protein [bacterium]
MKKFLLPVAALSLAFAAQAQEVGGNTLAEQKRQIADPEAQARRTVVVSHSNAAPEAPFYTEDFAAGLPTGWVIEVAPGLDPDGVWAYRGPSTTPGVNAGSRGAYAAANDPIASPTFSNGYFIFDSDFLDNAGIAGNFGGGVAASPHTSHLVSSTIDLTGRSSVDFQFSQYYRRFAGPGGSQAVVATYVDFSIDGGATWPYTLTINTDIPVNQATADNDRKEYPVGQWLANQSNVKFRFRFDGDYYFWMIDDIAMDATPDYRMLFSGWRGAPDRDIIYGPAAGSATMGQMSNKQKRSIEFDCNVASTGAAPLHNTRLFVDIYNGASLVTTLSSTPHNGTVGFLDTLGFDTLNTYATPWTPAGMGTYDFRFRVLADSASSGGTVLTLISDTNSLFVTDSVMAQDFNFFSNSLGTDQLGDDLSAIGARIDLVEPDRLFAVEVVLSTATVPGGQIELTVYDSAAFIDFTTGFIPGSAIATKLQTVSGQNVAARFIRFDLTDANGKPLSLPNASYFIVATFFSNAGANLIRVGNDATFAQRPEASIMYNTDDARWYSGFSGSRALNSPLFRAMMCPDQTCQNFPFSAEELQLEGVSVYPNPATDYVEVELSGNDGAYDVRLFDLSGRELHFGAFEKNGGTAVHRLDVSNIASGIYVLEVTQGNALRKFKLNIR